MIARKRNTGFVLLETLVALSLLTIGLYVFSDACHRQHSAFERAAALEKEAACMQSRNLVETLRINLPLTDCASEDLRIGR